MTASRANAATARRVEWFRELLDGDGSARELDSLVRGPLILLTESAAEELGAALQHADDAQRRAIQARRTAALARVIGVAVYVVGGLGLLLFCQRAAVQATYSDVFLNGLVTFIGWVGPLPFGIIGGVLVGRLFGGGGIVAGVLLWIAAAALSIWQAFW